MDWLTPENVVAIGTSVLGLAGTFYVLWREQGLWAARRRIGYRVQMATPIGTARASSLVTALNPLFPDVPRDATLVLLRIENDGKHDITLDSYASPENSPGLEVVFPEGLTVRAAAATAPNELQHLTNFLTPGLTHSGNRLLIPKTPLNSGQHFKLLVVTTGGEVNPDKVEVQGGILGGRVVRTSSMSVDAKPPIFHGPGRYLAGALTLLLLGLSAIILFLDDTPPPRGCEKGRLRIVGSTAFQPVAEALAGAYMKDCPGSRIDVEAHGSAAGTRELDGLGQDARAAHEDAPAVIALSDGPADRELTGLVPSKVAVSAFALVVNDSVPVTDLSLAQVRRIYAGEITDWSQITKKGPKQPVVLVSRGSSSGTRAALQRRLLNDSFELNDSSTDCVHRTNPDVPVVRCELDSTDQVLERIGQLPGAIGYSELRETEDLEHMHRLSLGGHRPTIGSIATSGYPFHEIEYAYTYGSPPDSSLTNSFLGYVLEGEGKRTVSAFGHLPCEISDGLKACALR
ncbi:substrate-binding domain-containing protein [Streptomyces sp. NPDC050560]|uniref:substrate-binding domain-containing protein n=1 Tax=Streptomyces sp. NPDC050560 TaxID=3365630 RepID=UPI0037A13832